MPIDPVAHDTALAALYETRANLQIQRQHHQARLTRQNDWEPDLLQRAAAAEAEISKLDEELSRNAREIEKLNAQYTGWSRFFLVTSSQGHIHRSMSCSTCFMQTEYGWLPEFSGKTEAEAVEQLGPNLCSVCYPSAPVEHTLGKVSKKAAQDLVWSSDREDRLARKEQERQDREARAAKKAANALKYAERIAPKVNALATEFGWEPQQGQAFFDAEDKVGYQAVTAFEDIRRERERLARRGIL